MKNSEVLDLEAQIDLQTLILFDKKIHVELQDTLNSALNRIKSYKELSLGEFCIMIRKVVVDTLVVDLYPKDIRDPVPLLSEEFNSYQFFVDVVDSMNRRIIQRRGEESDSIAAVKLFLMWSNFFQNSHKHKYLSYWNNLITLANAKR